MSILRSGPAGIAFLAIFLGLTILCGAALLVSLRYETSARLHAEHQVWERQLDLASDFMREHLLRNNYQEVQQFLRQWTETDPRIHSLIATYPNGSLLFLMEDMAEVAMTTTLEQMVRASGRDRLHIKLTVSMAETAGAARRSLATIITIFVVFVLSAATLTWWAVWFWAIRPLEESRRRTIEAQAQADKAAHHLEAVIEGAPDGILTVNEALTVTSFNRTACQMFGYEKDEVIGQPLSQLLAPQDIETHQRSALALIRSGSALDGRFMRGRHRDGTLFPLHVSVSSTGTPCSQDGSEDERSFTAILHDLTHEMTQQANLRKLARAINQTSSLIMITDPDGVIEFVNARFTEMTGYAAAEAIGQTPRILKSADTPPHVHEDLWTTVLSGQEWKGTLKDRRKDGQEFWVSATISPVRDSEGVLSNFIAVHEDITLQTLARQELMLAKEQAEAANRAKSELIANMSHELRTPLNAIIGYSDALLLGIFGPIANERQQDYLRDIQSSGHHLLDLINDILDVSAIELGRLDIRHQTVDVATVVDVSLRLVRPRAQQGRVSLSASLPETPCLLTSDERRLKQCIVNLLSNAVKFTPPGGSVCCQVEEGDAGALVIRITDTGIGMTPEEMEIALSRFGQVDSGLNRRHEGTGLGLPLTEGLAELLGGRFSLESRKDKGTTASLIFPAPLRVAPALPSTPLIES